MRQSGPQSVCEFRTLPSAVAFLPAITTVQAVLSDQRTEARNKESNRMIFFIILNNAFYNGELTKIDNFGDFLNLAGQS